MNDNSTKVELSKIQLMINNGGEKGALFALLAMTYLMDTSLSAASKRTKLGDILQAYGHEGDYRSELERAAQLFAGN